MILAIGPARSSWPAPANATPYAPRHPRRPHLPAALHQALRTADCSVTAGIEAARRHYYGTPLAEPPPADEPAAPASRWLTLPAAPGLRPLRDPHAHDESDDGEAE
ncbi:hypothetical protein CQW39_31090 [Streptomyces griseofuscus]|nr:hypothetical protein CQW39_31090 [Streptomyces griseofuscus]